MLSCCGFSRVSGSQSGIAVAVFGLSLCSILAAQLILFLSRGWLLAMSSIPQGAFAAFKVHQDVMGEKKQGYKKYNADKQSSFFNKKLVEQSPLKYNSKMMNSIWGQYNRYSVHNMKKNTDAKEVLVWEEQRLATATPPAFHVPGFTPNFFN